MCFQSELIKKCNCFSTWIISNLSSNTPCVDLNQTMCFFSLWYEFQYTNLELKCDQCPLECETNNFPLSLSFSDYPNKNYAMFLYENSFLKSAFGNKPFDFNELKKNVLSFSVFFDQLKYTNITQIPKYYPLDLIASIGGFLGLLLGTSLLTFVEIIESILTIILIFFKKLKRRKFRS